MIVKFKRKGKESFWQTIFFSTLIGILVLTVIGFLVYENFKVNQRRSKLISRIETLGIEIQELENKKEFFKSGISQVEMEEYVERIAREELNLQKKGEKVVGFILPEEEIKEKTAESFWKKWWEWVKNRVTD